MKRYLSAGVAFIVIALCWFILYIQSKHINRTLDGLEYLAGIGREHVIPVSLKVSGTLSKAINGVTTFQGTIAIHGATQTNPDNGRSLTIHFDNKGFGSMDYWSFADGKSFVESYGFIFINNDFSKVTILEAKGGVRYWNSNSLTNGLTISAPATDRSEAVVVSNELMRNWLMSEGGKLIK